MYFHLDTDGRENVYMELELGLNGHIALGMGKSWDVEEDEIDVPYRFAMIPTTEVREGAAARLDAWYPGSHLMQKSLIDALSQAGIDNLQTFPAEIRREDTGAEVPGYVVVNIVGRVSCAKMEESTKEHLLGNAYYFHDLVIDPERVGGLLMFRLHESTMVVIVHEVVARSIEGGNYLGLVLEPLAEATSK
jgi:hypothetical protein